MNEQSIERERERQLDPKARHDEQRGWGEGQWDAYLLGVRESHTDPSAFRAGYQAGFRDGHKEGYKSGHDQGVILGKTKAFEYERSQIAGFRSGFDQGMDYGKAAAADTRKERTDGASHGSNKLQD